MAYENMIDLSQDMPALKMLYAPLQHHFRVLDVPALPFAILDGKGAPEPVAVGAAIKTLQLAIESIRREARQRMGRHRGQVRAGDARGLPSGSISFVVSALNEVLAEGRTGAKHRQVGTR